MATNRDLLKEAIADAKAVKEAAIANAKVALEEAFTPFLKEKLALTLSEMDEDLGEAETDELEEYLLNNPSPEGKGNAFSRQPHGNLEEEGEMDLEELLRELEEEAGIVLREDYQLEALRPLFINKASANKYYPYLLPLSERDYHEVVAKGDGSKEEEMSKAVKVDVKYLSSLNPSDLITDYMILKLKEYLNLK